MALLSYNVVQELLNADAVFAVAWNSAQQDIVATGGGDDIAYLWQVSQLQPA